MQRDEGPIPGASGLPLFAHAGRAVETRLRKQLTCCHALWWVALSTTPSASNSPLWAGSITAAQKNDWHSWHDTVPRLSLGGIILKKVADACAISKLMVQRAEVMSCKTQLLMIFVCAMSIWTQPNATWAFWTLEVHSLLRFANGKLTEISPRSNRTKPHRNNPRAAWLQGTSRLASMQSGWLHYRESLPPQRPRPSWHKPGMLLQPCSQMWLRPPPYLPAWMPGFPHPYALVSVLSWSNGKLIAYTLGGCTAFGDITTLMALSFSLNGHGLISPPSWPCPSA